ncbi:hypothetical protein [Corynebacterium dentalis]|uniref:hypothetical protein n=1 Tax=Corynebacterium dentalis TaxID=2014528 RepID=UPI0011775496|nr:hypothetical protein [Corynebacterium dentalis]
MDSTPKKKAARCAECGNPVHYEGRGRRPKYCSSSCRHRAWETRRAASQGKVAREIVETVVEVETPINADTVAHWLDGHPRRLSAVIRLMEWTPEQQQGLRFGLEKADTDLTVITQSERSRHTRAPSMTPLQRLENAQLQQQVESLTRANEELKRQLQHRSQPEAQPLNPTRNLSSPMPSETRYKTTTVNGKNFRVPADWSRQQIRHWCRTHPEQGQETT